MSDAWDDSVDEVQDHGRSFGKGRGFCPRSSSRNTESENYHSNFGGDGRNDRADRNVGARGFSGNSGRENYRSNFGDDRRYDRADRNGGARGFSGNSGRENYRSNFGDDGRRDRGDRNGDTRSFPGNSGSGNYRSNSGEDRRYGGADRNGDARGFSRNSESENHRSNFGDERRYDGADRNEGTRSSSGNSGSGNYRSNFGDDRRNERADRNEGTRSSSGNSGSGNYRSNFGDDRRSERADRNEGRFGNNADDRSRNERFNGNRREWSDREGDRHSSWGHSKDNDDDDTPFDGGDSRERRGARNDDSGNEWDAGSDDKKEDLGEEEVKKPEPVTYVPDDKTEDQLFAETGIQKGINFDDYENINVNVTGKDVPPPINSFQEAGFRELIMMNLRKCDYGRPTPIQKYAIPIIEAGHDLMATAQTGSGKTAAFLLPIIQKLLGSSTGSFGSDCASPQALIFSPTRELAIQIYENARVYAAQSSLRVEIVYGGVQTRHHRSRISRGCNILVATPGRLTDFVKRGYVKFDEIQFFVLDEADRMLDMGFIDDIKTVMYHETMTSEEFRQTLMFSATFSSEIQRLAGEFLRRDYAFLAVGIVGGACKDVEQNFMQVDRREKKPKLVDLLNVQEDIYGTLLFVEQKRSADFLATYLSENNFKATSIHGDRKQFQREQALYDFKTRRMAILVATNVAARGLDIRGVKHVINFDLPKEIDEYVHRIGRTGRLGNKGKATSFYDSSADSALANNLVRILKEANQKVPDFLEQDATGMGDYETGMFGAHDYRRHEDGLRSDGNQPVPLNDDEDW